MSEILETTILASTVLVPLTFFAFGGTSAIDIFRVRSKTEQAIFGIVMAFQMVAAILWLTWRTRWLNEPIMLWAGIVFLAYIWGRVFVVTQRERQARL